MADTCFCGHHLEEHEDPAGACLVCACEHFEEDPEADS